MGPIQATIKCMSQPFTFAGRASRSEFWWFTLVGFAIVFFLAGLAVAFFVTSITALEGDAGPTGSSSFAYIAGAMLLWPMFAQLSVTVRRLHDTDRSGWWYWITLVPLVGYIVLLIFLVAAGDDGRNAYGASPGGATGKAKGAKSRAPARKVIPKGLPGEPYNPINELTTSEELRALRASRMAN